jgi:hypothetical protein
LGRSAAPLPSQPYPCPSTPALVPAPRPQRVGEVWEQLESEVQQPDLPAASAPGLLLHMLALQAEGLPVAQVRGKGVQRLLQGAPHLASCSHTCCLPRPRDATSFAPPPPPATSPAQGKDPVGLLLGARERRFRTQVSAAQERHGRAMARLKERYCAAAAAEGLKVGSLAWWGFWRWQRPAGAPPQA